jgi:hypothetical protein
MAIEQELRASVRRLKRLCTVNVFVTAWVIFVACVKPEPSTGIFAAAIICLEVLSTYCYWQAHSRLKWVTGMEKQTKEDKP